MNKTYNSLCCCWIRSCLFTQSYNHPSPVPCFLYRLWYQVLICY